MYELILSKRASRQLHRISWRYQDIIVTAFDDLRENPLEAKTLGRDLTKRLSYRVGVYRIVYKVSIQDKTITVLSIGHRATVYN